MFEDIICQGVSEVSGTTIVDYRPFPGEEVDITVMFKPNAGGLYGPHVLVMGLFETEGCLVSTRNRQGLDTDGSILSVTINRIQYT